MANVVIVADDLTGANATSVLLVRNGFRASTFLNLDKYREEASHGIDVISISTDSRGVTGAEAYDRVGRVMDRMVGGDVALFSKRIDSTLRGNIGEEMRAMQERLPGHLAVIVPSFPSSGRVCIGGYLLVHQIPLENTDVGKDPKTPVRHSKVETILKEQYAGNVASIHLNCVLKGADAITRELQQIAAEGASAVIIDATTDEDIETIARAVKLSGLAVIAVDPGPFTAAVARQYMAKPVQSLSKKILFTIGSVSNLTRRQIEQMRLKFDPLIYHVDALNLLEPALLEREGAKAWAYLSERLDDYEILGITTTDSEDQVLDLSAVAARYQTTEEAISNRISDGLAAITEQILTSSNQSIGGLYTSGGDVTVAVCNRLNASGIIVKDEVVPLAVYGRLYEGAWDNFPIITKGGLVGDDTALIQCIDYLLTKISTEFYES